MNAMTKEEVVESLYPLIKWREPISITRLGDLAHGFGCRFCIAAYGLHARDIPSLFQTQEEWQAHMEQFHPKQAVAG